MPNKLQCAVAKLVKVQSSVSQVRSKSHNSPARRQHLTAALNAPGLDRSFRFAFNLFHSADSRKMEQEDLFLKNVLTFCRHLFEDLFLPVYLLQMVSTIAAACISSNPLCFY